MTEAPILPRNALAAMVAVGILQCGGRVSSVAGDAGVDAFEGSTSSSSGGGSASSSGVAVVGSSASSGGTGSNSGGSSGNGTDSGSGSSGDAGSLVADAGATGDGDTGHFLPHCLVCGGNGCCQACQQADPGGFMSLVVDLADCLCQGGPCDTSCSGPADFCHAPGEIVSAQCQNCIEAFTNPGSQCPAFSRTVGSACEQQQGCPQYAACAQMCP